MNKQQAIHSFWSGFGLTAYDENSVPDNAVMPYITYEFAESNFNNSILLNASLWYRSTSWETISAKANLIESTIGMGGVLQSYDNGAVWITRSNIFSRRVADDNDTIRRINMMINVEFFTEN